MLDVGLPHYFPFQPVLSCCCSLNAYRPSYILHSSNFVRPALLFCFRGFHSILCLVHPSSAVRGCMSSPLLFSLCDVRSFFSYLFVFLFVFEFSQLVYMGFVRIYFSAHYVIMGRIHWLWTLTFWMLRISYLLVWNLITQMCTILAWFSLRFPLRSYLAL